MLLAIRDRISGILAYIICGLIIIPFALWGVTDYLGYGQETPAIKFNDSETTMYAFENRLQFNQQQLAQQFGGELPDFINVDFVRQQTIDQIVNQEAVLQLLNERKMGSSPEEIFVEISSTPEFQEDGRFSPDAYERQILSAGYSKSAYEQQVASEITVRQLQQSILFSALATEAQLQQYSTVRNQTRDFEYFQLDINDYQARADIAEADIQAYYDDNVADLLTDRTVSVDYVEIKADDIAQTIAVSDDILREQYESGAISALEDSPESRLASHILILSDDTFSEAEKAEKRTLIEDIQRRSATEDFAALATEFSEDAGSAASGGDLGDVFRGEMVPEFEAALFAMQEGDISDVVETEFGYHLIKLNKITPAQRPSFEEAKSDIADIYKAQEAERLFFEQADELANLVFEQPDNLLAVEEALGLPIQTTQSFTRDNGVGIAANQQVRDIAFSPEVLDDGLNSEIIELESESHIVVLRLNDYQPAREKTLAEARAEIETILVNEWVQKKLLEDGIALVEQIASEQSNLVEAAGNAEIFSFEAVDRDNQDVDAIVLREAFLIDAVDDVTLVDMRDGSKAIIQLNGKVDGDYTQLSAGIQQRVKNELRDGVGRSSLDNLIAAYIDSATIEYHPSFNISEE